MTRCKRLQMLVHNPVTYINIIIEHRAIKVGMLLLYPSSFLRPIKSLWRFDVFFQWRFIVFVFLILSYEGSCIFHVKIWSCEDPVLFAVKIRVLPWRFSEINSSKGSKMVSWVSQELVVSQVYIYIYIYTYIYIHVCVHKRHAPTLIMVIQELGMFSNFY